MVQPKKILTNLKKQVTSLQNDRKHFVAAEETLASFLKKNTARYALRPSESAAWRRIQFPHVTQLAVLPFSYIMA